jgi:hypothetical protein
MFTGTDKISESVNDSDSDCSSFTEISDSDTCMLEYILTTINKKKIFSIIIHMNVLHKSSLRYYCSLRGIIHTTHAVSVQMSWDRLLALLTIL